MRRGAAEHWSASARGRTRAAEHWSASTRGRGEACAGVGVGESQGLGEVAEEGGELACERCVRAPGKRDRKRCFDADSPGHTKVGSRSL